MLIFSICKGIFCFFVEHYFFFVFQFDGRRKFGIPEKEIGDIVVTSPLDYEAMRLNGREFYMLNVSVQVT